MIFITIAGSRLVIQYSIESFNGILTYWRLSIICANMSALFSGRLTDGEIVNVLLCGILPH